MQIILKEDVHNLGTAGEVVTVKPGPQQVQNLQVNVNGVIMPNELLGIARPLNPGTYRFSAQAVGWSTSAPIDVPLGEKEQKSVELTLVQGGGAVVVTPPPPPYAGGNAATPERAKPRSGGGGGPTSAGMLLGIHGGAVIPTGEVANNQKIDTFATAGGGGGIDVYLRLAKMLLLGATFDYASLGAPKNVSGTGKFDASTHTTYAGVNLGIIPSVDKVSFIGDVGVGSRTASQKLSQGVVSQESSATGLEFALSAGISIPAGPIRIVPKVGLGVGSFSSATANGTTVDIADTSTHTFVFLGLAAFYSLDFGAKPEPE